MTPTQSPEGSAAMFTPGPWRYVPMLSGSENHRGFHLYGTGSYGHWPFASVQPGDGDGALGEANARRIVQCVNAHDEMVDALREAETFVMLAVPHFAADRKEAVERVLPVIRAALQKARGEAK